MSRRYPDRPVVGVGAVVWRGDEILLVRRANPPRQGQWSLPGGGQELGETVREAARREVLEETGIDVEVAAVIDVVDSVERDEDGRILYHFTLVDVLATWVSGDPEAAADAAEAAWVRAAKLPGLGLAEDTARMIERGRDLYRSRKDSLTEL